jgi:hypothetical protein
MWSLYRNKLIELFTCLISLKLWGLHDFYFYNFYFLQFYSSFSIPYYSESMSPVFVELVSSSIFVYSVFWLIISLKNAKSLNNLIVYIKINVQNNRNTKWAPKREGTGLNELQSSPAFQIQATPFGQAFAPVILFSAGRPENVWCDEHDLNSFNFG